LTAQPINVRDMAIIHRTFRKAYDESARLVRTARAAPPDRATFLADHIDFAIAALHIHHEGEDELLLSDAHRAGPGSGPDDQGCGCPAEPCPSWCPPGFSLAGRCCAISVVPCPAPGLG